MNKIILVFLFFLIGITSVFASDGTYIYTNKWRNGYSFSDKEWSHPYNQHGYIDGLIDGLKYAKIISTDVSRDSAFEQLEKYYIDHPEKKQKPIIEVLLEKYKI